MENMIVIIEKKITVEFIKGSEKIKCKYLKLTIILTITLNLSIHLNDVIPPL